MGGVVDTPDRDEGKRAGATPTPFRVNSAFMLAVRRVSRTEYAYAEMC